MVDRVSLYRLISFLTEKGKTEEKKQKESEIKEEYKLTLSELAKELSQKEIREYTDKKIERIKELLQKGEYKTNDKAILEALKDFFT
ncbi:hypothetical protein JCM9492_12560 [Aquifex pyrophilus]